jgi:Uma2 family endonuclease
MALSFQQKPNIQDFEAFTKLPENNEKIFELINGEILEVPSNPYVSEIANLIGFFIRLFLMQNKLKGHVTGADGGYIINGDVYAPDVAYISYDRQPELARKGYNPNPPELAVEVISDPHNSQEQTTLRRKVGNYLTAGIIVWVVNPEDRTVDVYEIGQSVQVFDETGTLTVEGILPNFKLAVKDIFPAGEED